ncbi:DUF262 domain-containing protein [Flavobacterium sp. NKUCC04_CG]|uniref:GmrSD restriction endonuclease domain-containing protein n=1 Tax=Flavobacterium sp. NKUCC04_CG TaxID=2842121 RepID=UPI001C5B1CF2|nr:DUF262 domain-containing protein [Flavobacterium sp. NKUCC04_CG]MBW3518068.1 DUF262 domain-containing protein [Flavobacterium sp. NKUCC04_CG]
MAETFWKIIQDKIEIPEIQRDYAQGRINERVDAIRESIVSDLLDVLQSGKTLNLDFVFGQSVDKTNQANFNKSKQSLEQMLQVLKRYSEDAGVDFESKVASKPNASSADKVLIPFDGQQRLTTLFLLHLYLGTMAEKDVSILANFNYKTRDSTTQFIGKIIENRNVILHFNPQEYTDIKVLSESIKNQSWFFSSWQKDPTVAGMLVMLDEIRKQTIEKKIDCSNSWFNLTEKNCIDFDYFDIQEEGFDEDLYVKMNARGKGLTDFENFKAWLEKQHKNSLPDYKWEYQMDKDWLDLFWKTKKVVDDVDANFMAFFKNMAMLKKISTSTVKSDINYSLERELIELLKPTHYTPNSKYEQHNVFNETTLDYIFKILAIIASDKERKLDEIINEVWTDTFKGKIERSFTESLLTEFDGLNLYHKTFFFSIFKFLEVKGEIDINKYTQQDWDKFKDWLRVSRNLIYNSRIDDSTAYISAIMALNNLDKAKVLDINKGLYILAEDDEKINWISFFNENQRKEECEKTYSILSDVDALKWSELINKAENHFYFYGQIDFIFKLSNGNIQSFEEYLNKLSLLFSESNVTSDTYILQCLFFAFDEANTWLKRESANRFKFYKSSTGTSRDRNENWRILFDDDVKRSVLKDLLDSNSCEFDAITALIAAKKTNLAIDNWKYLILDEPTIFDHCGSALFTMPDEYTIRFLEKTLNSSRQRELRSYYWYTKIKKSTDLALPPFTNLWYFTGERGNLEPCIALTGWIYDEVDYFMDCHFVSNSFEIRFGRRTVGEIDKEIANTFMEKHQFEKKGTFLVLSNIPFDTVKSQLLLILSNLKDFNKKQ